MFITDKRPLLLAFCFAIVSLLLVYQSSAPSRTIDEAYKRR